MASADQRAQLTHRPAAAVQDVLTGAGDRLGVDPGAVGDPEAAQDGRHHHRPRPRRTVLDLQRHRAAVGESRTRSRTRRRPCRWRPARPSAGPPRPAGCPDTHSGKSPDRLGHPVLRALRSRPPAAAKARASPTSVVANSGAPQPSTATVVDRDAGQLLERRADRLLQWVVRLAVAARGRQPLTTQVASIAACLPEQFIAIRVRPCPPGASAARSASSSG